MTEDSLAQLVRDRAEAFGESAASWRPEDSQTAEQVHQLELHLAIWPPILSLLRQAARASWERAASGEVEKAASELDNVAAILDLTIETLDHMPGVVQEAVKLGYRVEGADIPARVKAEAVQFRNELSHYPRFTREVFDEAQAAYARGEFMEVLDAFAAMKGVTREEMERRLEEHKQKRKELGWE